MENKAFADIVERLTKDQTFAQKVLSLSPEAAADELKKEGYDVTVAELVTFIESAKKVLAEGADELSEASLEEVAGGKMNWDAFGAGLVFGTAAAALAYAGIVTVCLW